MTYASIRAMITLRFMLALQVLLANLITYVVAPAPPNLEPQLTWGSSKRDRVPRTSSSHLTRRGNSGSNLRNPSAFPSAHEGDRYKHDCFDPEPRSKMRIPRPSECQSAISMFSREFYTAIVHDPAHAGEPATSSQPARMNVWLVNKPGPRNPDHPPEIYSGPPQRKFVLPAVFHSGRCLVFVGPGDRRGFPKNVKEGPVDAATAMWFYFWEEATEVAKRLVKRCIARRRVGTKVTVLPIGRMYNFRYRVTISGTPKRNSDDPSYMPDPFPDEGWRIHMEEADEYWYTLYNINGTWSGPGTKGLWRADTGIVRAKAS